MKNIVFKRHNKKFALLKIVFVYGILISNLHQEIIMESVHLLYYLYCIKTKISVQGTAYHKLEELLQ